MDVEVNPHVAETSGDDTSSKLFLTVLGINFMISWGSSVSPEQRAQMKDAWARCVFPRPEPPHLSTSWEKAEFPFEAVIVKILDPGPQRTDEVPIHVLGRSFEELAERLTSQLTLAAIEAQASKLTMLHACGVSDPGTDRVVALVAKSGTGKTTAAAMLGKTFGYVTDETVAFDDDGMIVAYPKPLSVKRGNRFKDQTGPDELRLLATPARPKIHRIVLLNRLQESEPHLQANLEEVPLGDAILALIPETSSQAILPQPLQSICRHLASTGGLLRVNYSDASELPDIIASIFDAPAPATREKWIGRRPPEVHASVLPAGHFRQRPAADVIEVDGDLIILGGDQVLRISGIAPTLWETAREPASLGELIEGVAAVHGRPDDIDALVRSAVNQLVAGNILDEGNRHFS